MVVGGWVVVVGGWVVGGWVVGGWVVLGVAARVGTVDDDTGGGAVVEGALEEVLGEAGAERMTGVVAAVAAPALARDQIPPNERTSSPFAWPGPLSPA